MCSVIFLSAVSDSPNWFGKASAHRESVEHQQCNAGVEGQQLAERGGGGP
jgi:hypothetical protein